MDNLGKGNSGSEDEDKPIPFEDTSALGVSHSPLNLGGSGTAKAPAKPSAPSGQSAKPVAKAPTGKAVSSPDRITGVRTFFTKLHAGAIDFLDTQINEWLKENPGITIKRTNAVIGEIQAKKTEPNIIVVVWY